MTDVHLTNETFKEPYILASDVKVGQYFFARVGEDGERRLYLKAFEVVVDLLDPVMTYSGTPDLYVYAPIKRITITAK